MGAGIRWEFFSQTDALLYEDKRSSVVMVKYT